MAKKKHHKTKGGARTRTPERPAAVQALPSPPPAEPAGDLEDQVAVASNLMAAGDDQRAEGILTQMLEADPAHRPALEALGRLYMARQRFDEAVKVHNRLVVLYAPDPRVHNALGVSLLMAGQIEGALIHLTRSMELDPTNVRFITNLAKALMMKGSWGLAQELLEKAFVLSEGRQMEAILEALDYCNERSREQLQAGAA